MLSLSLKGSRLPDLSTGSTASTAGRQDSSGTSSRLTGGIHSGSMRAWLEPLSLPVGKEVEGAFALSLLRPRLSPRLFERD